MGGTCYGAVKPNQRLDTRLRPYQAYYCQYWPSSKCQIDYKSEQWNRLTEVFRFILEEACAARVKLQKI
jgi:TRAP-type mannitol/chloroaromatic compound transport system substrate-binding protein